MSTFPERLEAAIAHLDSPNAAGFGRLFGMGHRVLFKTRNFQLGEFGREKSIQLVCRPVFQAHASRGHGYGEHTVTMTLWQLADGRFMFEFDKKAIILTAEEISEEGIGPRLINLFGYCGTLLENILDAAGIPYKDKAEHRDPTLAFTLDRAANV